MRYEEVYNRFDGEAYAVKFTLECNHHVIATGTFVFNSGYLRCKKCFDNGTD